MITIHSFLALIETDEKKGVINNITMEILQVNNLCKTYGKGETQVDALRNVSFSLEKGTFCAVVGESGSGKSTLLNCIGALDTPTSGQICIDGHNLFTLKEKERTIFRRRNIGFIFQSFQLVAELTVEQNIVFPLLLDHCRPDAAFVEETLEILDCRTDAAICQASSREASSSVLPSDAH